MYNYSPISKLYIKNFRNLGNVTIDFDQSPIVTLVGENEAGKTSVIKAFATCALHACPRDQKDYIRDGTKMFGVAIDLKDGHRITRIKELTGINSYQITDASGTTIFSTNKLAEGLPIEVQKLMGLIEEPETKEFLHIRTYEDKLLFVVTPNSTNYKVMYNALKVEQLTKAIKLGSNEANELKNKINNNEVSINTLQNQIRDIAVYDIEPLINVRDRLKEQLSTLSKIAKAKELLDKVDSYERDLGALALLDKFNLQPIDVVVSDKMSRVNNIISRLNEQTNLLSRYSELSSIEEIDTSVVSKISNIIEKKNNLDRKVAEAGTLVQVANISEISEVEAMHLDKISKLINSLNQLTAEYSKQDVSECKDVTDTDIKVLGNIEKVIELLNSSNSMKSDLTKVEDYIVQMDDYLKKCGVAVETCPKCGEAVIFDIDKL